MIDNQERQKGKKIKKSEEKRRPMGGNTIAELRKK